MTSGEGWGKMSAPLFPEPERAENFRIFSAKIPALYTRAVIGDIPFQKTLPLVLRYSLVFIYVKIFKRYAKHFVNFFPFFFVRQIFRFVKAEPDMSVKPGIAEETTHRRIPVGFCQFSYVIPVLQHLVISLMKTLQKILFIPLHRKCSVFKYRQAGGIFAVVIQRGNKGSFVYTDR